MERTNKPLKLGFERDLVEVSLDLLLGSKHQPATLKQSVKYSQIRASIKAIGIVEPLAVIPHPAHQGSYMVLDGHLRLEALKELQSEIALCLISKDDEAYTYNKRVNRLSAIQEHRMIVRAMDRGVSPETLADALDIPRRPSLPASSCLTASATKPFAFWPTSRPPGRCSTCFGR